MSLRTRLNETLKDAMKAQDACAVATIRLVLAAVKDREIANRTEGADATLNDDQILNLLQSMIKQRNESIAMYRDGGRDDLVKREQSEIAVIRAFLPEQMDEAQMIAAVEATIAELNAESLKDMGRTMAALKERHAGRMDFARASGLVRERLV